MRDQFLKLLSAKLQEHAIRLDLERLALDGCDLALRNCLRDDIAMGIEPLGGWPIEQIQRRFVKNALVFHYEGWDHVYVETVIGLYVRDPVEAGPKKELPFDWPIGTYRLMTSEDGEFDDDSLVIN
jgi:hypothetical protein